MEWVKTWALGLDLKSRKDLGLNLSSTGDFGKLGNLSKPPFVHLWNEDNVSFVVSWRQNGYVMIQCTVSEISKKIMHVVTLRRPSRRWEYCLGLCLLMSWLCQYNIASSLCSVKWKLCPEHCSIDYRQKQQNKNFVIGFIKAKTI